MYGSPAYSLFLKFTIILNFEIVLINITIIINLKAEVSQRRIDMLYHDAFRAKYIINCPSSGFVISNMDALSQEVSQAAIFEDCNCLYLHCIDTKNKITLKIPGLPILSMRGLFAHISFLDSQAIRQICIVPNSPLLLQKLKGINSPCVITVTSSTEFKVRLVY